MQDVIRRTRYDLKKCEARVHILEGLKIALDNIDEVIKIIKASKTDQIAKEQLTSKFGLDEVQCEAILEMKLRRLTGLEKDKIENELKDLLARIEELKSILASEQKVLDIIKAELLEIKDNYPKYVVLTDDFAGGNYQGIKTMHITDFLLSKEY